MMLASTPNLNAGTSTGTTDKSLKSLFPPFPHLIKKLINCYACNKNKPTDKFHGLGDGFQKRCKDCISGYAKNRYILKKDKISESNRRWKEMSMTKERYKRYKANYKRKNPEGHKAHILVATAVASGRLKPNVCEVANCKNKGEAHHDDYSQPLKVRWLCHQHHIKHHYGTL